MIYYLIVYTNVLISFCLLFGSFWCRSAPRSFRPSLPPATSPNGSLINSEGEKSRRGGGRGEESIGEGAGGRGGGRIDSMGGSRQPSSRLRRSSRRSSAAAAAAHSKMLPSRSRRSRNRAHSHPLHLVQTCVLIDSCWLIASFPLLASNRIPFAPLALPSPHPFPLPQPSEVSCESRADIHPSLFLPLEGRRVQQSPHSCQLVFVRATVAEHPPAPFAQRSTIDALRPSPFAMSVTIKIYFSLPSGKQEVSE